MHFHTVQSTVYITFVLMSTTVLCRDGAIVYKITNTNTNKGPPKITEGNSSIVIVQQRDNVELSCPIKSFPPPLYEWYKENPYESSPEMIFGPTQIWHRFELTVQGHLKIRSVTDEDSGTYICKAVNGFGAKSFSTKLAVTGEDPFKDNLLKSSANRKGNYNESVAAPKINRMQLPADSISKANKGSNLHLKCEAKGNPIPNVTWFKGDKIVGEAKDSVSVLKFNQLRESDRGLYRCEAVNRYGKDIYEVVIQVTGWGDEILELKPNNLTLYAGKSGNITCVARYESVLPSFFWLKKVDNVTTPYYNNRLMENTNANTNPNDIGNVYYRDGVYYRVLHRSEVKDIGKNVYSTELNLNNVSTSDAGVYYCLVLGLMGFDSSEAQVFVEADPEQVAKTLLEKRNAAAVQWSILWVFAFLIVAIILIFFVVRQYGCLSSLKKTQTPTPQQSQRSNRRSCATLTTTLQQQREAFQPLVHKSTPSSSLFHKSQSSTHFDISINSQSGIEDSESCHCHCIQSACVKPSNGFNRTFYHQRLYRPTPCNSTVSMGSVSSQDYAITLPHLHQSVPPPSSESNFYEQKRIFHPNRGNYYYHHLRRSNGSDVSSSVE